MGITSFKESSGIFEEGVVRFRTFSITLDNHHGIWVYHVSSRGVDEVSRLTCAAGCKLQ